MLVGAPGGPRSGYGGRQDQMGRLTDTIEPILEP